MATIERIDKVNEGIELLITEERGASKRTYTYSLVIDPVTLELMNIKMKEKNGIQK